MSRRLLVVTDTLVGGQGGAAARHAGWFAERGWDVSVAAPGSEPHAHQVPNHMPVSIPLTARDLGGVRRAARHFREVRTGVQPDVIHCHGGRAFVTALASGARRPFVTLHGIMPVSSDPPGYRIARRTVLTALPPFAAGAFSVSPDAPPGWLFIPHASDRLTGLGRLGPPTSATPNFLWLGRLDEPKRPDVFVRAMAGVEGATGFIAGTGPLEADVRRLIAERGANVEMLGHRSDVSSLLAAAWGVVLFSDHEGVPFSIEEAMWVGRAVVASPIPGLRWLVGDDRQLPANVAGVSAALRRLSDRRTAMAIGDENADRVRRLVGVDDPWPELERRYECPA